MFPYMVQVLQVCLFSVMLFGKYLRCLSKCIECGFTLKCVRDMTKTYSKMDRTDKYLQHSSIIWLIWPNGWVFVYEVSGCGFESSRSHLNVRFRACFEQWVPWHSGNYRVWIQSETRTWHDKSLQYLWCDVLVKF